LGRGKKKRTFNICFAWVSDIPNIWIAHRFVLRAGERYMLQQRMFL
jgi:hypothetical protein